MSDKHNTGVGSQSKSEQENADADLKNVDQLYDQNMNIVGAAEEALDDEKAPEVDPGIASDQIKKLFPDRRKREAVVSVNYGSNWMVTFTDLVALMLTFFVLLYSMSVMEEKKWRNLVDSLSSNLKIERVVAEPKPANSLTMEPVDFIPGEDLDYLSSLIEEKLKEDSELSGAILTRLEDSLVLSLPGDVLFTSGSVEPQEKAEEVLIKLGGMFRYINNKIEIAGHADPAVPSGEGEYTTNWPLSLARADYVAGLLEKTGYKSSILSRGYGDSRYDDITTNLSESQRNKLARRVDIVVHSYAGENG